jgi:hypothetical protein
VACQSIPVVPASIEGACRGFGERALDRVEMDDQVNRAGYEEVGRLEGKTLGSLDGVGRQASEDSRRVVGVDRRHGA